MSCLHGLLCTSAYELFPWDAVRARCVFLGVARRSVNSAVIVSGNALVALGADGSLSADEAVILTGKLWLTG